MPVINLLNQTAKGKSVEQNSANLINMYMTEDQDQGKYPEAAYPTPGATLFGSAGSSVIRALFSEHGVTYGIDGATFFSVNSSGTRTTKGTLSTSTGWAKIRGIGDQLLIADGTHLYVYKITANTFSTIVATNYVSSIVLVTSGSGYLSPPTVTISDSTGTGATATATIAGGQVTAVVLTAVGSGYTAPTVAITGGSGTGATATVFITATSPPTSIQDIETQDEFGLVLNQNSQIWNASAVSDLTTWPVLAFASTTGNQNYNVGIVSVHREVYLLGTQTTEVWDNLGSANFTFGRNQTAFIEYGCAARSSIAKGDNTFFFLAVSPTGGNVVMRMTGYTPSKISTRAIDYQLSTYTTVSDAVGFMYQQEGHEFYVLTLPTAGVTWVYDLSTSKWHQRQSLVAAAQVQWFAGSYTFNYNKCLVGDTNTGNILQLDMTNFTENGAAITRTLITHPFYEVGVWIYADKLQVDFDNTPAASLSNWNLYVSRDGGNTFGSAKAAVPQLDANSMYRVYWTRLGQSRAFVLKLSTNANMKTIILGAWLNARPGASI